MKTWCAVIVAVGIAVLSENARGASADLTEAEGGIGLQAWLEVDKRYRVFSTSTPARWMAKWVGSVLGCRFKGISSSRGN